MPFLCSWNHGSLLSLWLHILLTSTPLTHFVVFTWTTTPLLKYNSPPTYNQKVEQENNTNNSHLKCMISNLHWPPKQPRNQITLPQSLCFPLPLTIMLHFLPSPQTSYISPSSLSADDHASYFTDNVKALGGNFPPAGTTHWAQGPHLRHSATRQMLSVLLDKSSPTLHFLNPLSSHLWTLLQQFSHLLLHQYFPLHWINPTNTQTLVNFPIKKKKKKNPFLSATTHLFTLTAKSLHKVLGL